MLTGNGDGTFQAAVPIVSLTLVVCPAIADFNRDGSPDVALTATGFGVAAFLNLSHPPPPLTVVSAASFAGGPLAPDSFAAAFGEGIVPLSGIEVSVEDSAGTMRPASAYFNSESQLNFLIPAATATGPATVAVTTTTGKQFVAQTQIAAIAPALFSVGANIAAAYAVFVSPAGAQSYEPVYLSPYPAGPTNSIWLSPINLSLPGQIYLILFGTGFDAASAATTSASIQGLTLPVTYAGPQPTIPGLDQINVVLPQSLAGTGVATVSVSTGSVISNQVFVSIR